MCGAELRRFASFLPSTQILFSPCLRSRKGWIDRGWAIAAIRHPEHSLVRINMNEWKVVRVEEKSMLHSEDINTHARRSRDRRRSNAINRLRMAQEMRPIETCHWFLSLAPSQSNFLMGGRKEAGGEEISNYARARRVAEIPSQFAHVPNKCTKESLCRLHRLVWCLS